MNPKISKEKKKWVGKRTTTLNGLRLNYNVGIAKKYEQKLRWLIKKMSDETTERLINLFKGKASKQYFSHQKSIATSDESISSQAKILINELMDKFNKLFKEKSKLISESMINENNKASSSSLNSSFEKLSGLSIATDFIPKGLNEVIKGSINENVSLITSIPQKYFSDISGSVMRSITTGNGLKDLVPEMEKYYGQTNRRAKNIAYDQTRKAYNSINKQRMMSIGYKKFKWLHSGGSQYPRKLHIKMSGNIYSFDDLPIIDENTGETGIPGQAINCHCTMTPVYEFENGEQI